MTVQAEEEILIKGTPICRGIGFGPCYFFSIAEESFEETKEQRFDPEKEIARYQNALNASLEDIKTLQMQLEEEKALEACAILDAQRQMLLDPILNKNVEEEIRRSSKSSDEIFQKVIAGYNEKFKKIADPLFQDRFKDLQDISRRILNHLRQKQRISLAHVPENSVVFSAELTASDTATAKSSHVAAFITSVGGSTSHAAIVAKSKGIPYVACEDFERFAEFKSKMVIVDGRSGEIIINPSENTLLKYQTLKKELQKQFSALEISRNLLAETFDGYRIRLTANVENVDEAELIHSYCADGIGLFRSEYILLAKRNLPTEDEQFEIYRTLIKKMRESTTVIRTFDVSGDKFNLSCSFHAESFDCRPARFILKRPDIFKTQLRAILRASAFGNVHILFPMISTLSELRDAKRMLQESKEELHKRGELFDQKIRVGCMIEVPSAAMISDLLAKECDFFSIGTNDLVQYSFAITRGNYSMSEIFNPTHPSVIRFIKLIVTQANQYKIPVTVCGEIASDPRFTPLLLGLGIQELSVSLRYIPTIKNAIRHTSILEACALTEEALHLTTEGEVLQLLNETYRKCVPNDSFYHF